MREEEFFIGWQANAPRGVSNFVKVRAFALILLGLAVAAVATMAQRPFASSNFEFGVVRTFEGQLGHRPFPVLSVDRPGGSGASHWLLTVFGKRGADEFTLPLDGHRVRFQGSLIHRDNAVMVELVPDSIEDLGPSPPGIGAMVVGKVTLDGEIVDSKCFLGVMKPGQSKSHRACAARCISGGVPPVLLTRDEEGIATYYLLVGADGGSVNQDVLGFVAEPVTVTGQLEQLGDLRILRADPARYVRR